MKNIAIIGSGSWGVALAVTLGTMGHNIKIWSYSEEEKDLINKEHKCKFLPNVVIPNNVVCTTSCEEAIKDTSIICPTFHAWLTALLWGAVTRQQQVAMVYGKGNVLTLWLRTECEQ